MPDDLDEALKNYEKLVALRGRIFNILIENKDDDAEAGRRIRVACLAHAEICNENN